MRKVKRKESGFTRFARRLLMFTFALFALGIVGLNAYESEINIDVQKTRDEITVIEADIDGLDMKKLELASFPHVEAIAKEKGYTYKQSTMTAAVVGVQRGE